MGLFTGLRQRRSKRADRAPITSKAEQRAEHRHSQSYAPPAGPPPLRPTTFPYALRACYNVEHIALNAFLTCLFCFDVLKYLRLNRRIAEDAAMNLSTQGWTEADLTQTPDDPLLLALQQLIEASKTFFACEEDYKRQFGSMNSEEGWSRIEGEKELLTIRQDGDAALPKEVRRAATQAWDVTASVMNELLGCVARTLDLEPEALTQYSSPALHLDGTKKSTMMRLFRYEPGVEDVVAEPHHDLGLLSLVYGDRPGLEVWEIHSQDFFPIEKTFTTPKASVLAGMQLYRLTNARYIPGGHLVRSYPLKGRAEDRAKQYRYSVVFIQRAHWPVPIDTDKLTTSITGPFQMPLRNMTAWDFFSSSYDSHYNINASRKVRDKQRQKLQTLEEAHAKTQTASADTNQGEPYSTS